MWIAKRGMIFINSRGISVVVPFEIHRAGNGSAPVKELIDATGEF
jgi:hypothetical protein